MNDTVPNVIVIPAKVETPQDRLFKAFPGLRSTRYKEALERLRRRMGQ